MRLFAAPRERVSDNRPEAAIEGPGYIASRWLPVLEQRVQASILPSDQEDVEYGRWLRVESARTAVGFFRLTSDVLPGEPFIYGSSSGDLVAEFTARNGTLTGIITESRIILYAVVNGIPVERMLAFGNDSPEPAVLRRLVQDLSDRLSMGRNGAVDTTR